MGTHDYFKKKKQPRQPRKHDFRNPKVDSYLIVTEGERTEPFYFDGLKKRIEAKNRGNLHVVRIDVKGKGRSTRKLIDYAEKTVKNAKKMYENVWLVFDKDDFADFDEAIRNADEKRFYVAWSNQSFEYWLFLHFEDCPSGLYRKDWVDKLDKIFREKGLGTGGYTKVCEDIFEIADGNGSVKAAVSRAKKRMSEFDGSRQNPSDFDPGTTVYQLVEELMQYLDD